MNLICEAIDQFLDKCILFCYWAGTVSAVSAAGALGVGAGIWYFRKVRAKAPVTCGVQSNENRLFWKTFSSNDQIYTLPFSFPYFLIAFYTFNMPLWWPLFLCLSQYIRAHDLAFPVVLLAGPQFILFDNASFGW